MPRIHNLQQITRLALLQREQEPLVEDQKLDLFVLLNEFAVGAIAARDCQFAQQVRQPHVFDSVEISAGRQAGGTTYECFSYACGSKNDNVVVFLNVGAGSKPGDLRLVQLPVWVVLNVLYAGGVRP
jgi:hypothetical protein